MIKIANKGYYISKASTTLKEKGVYKGTILILKKLIDIVFYIIKIPIQVNFLYKVSKKKWQKALDDQFQIFSSNENYVFYQIKDVEDQSIVRKIVLDYAKKFMDVYEKLGYPFTVMFKELMPHNAKVLQLAVGACPELVHLVEDFKFEYYIEDPLFPNILNSVDLRKIFKKEIKDFCDLPAETMWTSYPEFFDVIVCHNVLNHTYNPGNVIDSMFKMIKTGGLIFDLTMRQFSGYSHPGIIGYRALTKGYTSRGFEIIYTAIFKHSDSKRMPKKQNYYTILRKK